MTATSKSSSSGSASLPTSEAPKSLFFVLQQSSTIPDILTRVGCAMTCADDLTGSLASLTLVRLSKLWIAADNERMMSNEFSTTIDSRLSRTQSTPNIDDNLLRKGLENIIDCLMKSQWSSSSSSIDMVVEGLKAMAVIARINRHQLLEELEPKQRPVVFRTSTYLSLVGKLHDEAASLVPLLLPHHLSGLKWTLDCLRVVVVTETQEVKDRYRLPSILQTEYDKLDLPFRILPGLLETAPQLAGKSSSVIISECVGQVDFQSDTIQTSSNRRVRERRQTAWQGDEHVAPFAYSGKSMERMPWSPLVKTIRDVLWEKTTQYYDGCLLNLYPDGESGMRYHSDPDQGTLWGFETSVVSLGATRRFAFRRIRNDAAKLEVKHSTKETPHAFVLFNGDVTEMFNDCQNCYQHTVKTSDMKKDAAPRVSLVFKKTIQ